jgi:hypothetical protein
MRARRCACFAFRCKMQVIQGNRQHVCVCVFLCVSVCLCVSVYVRVWRVRGGGEVG